MKPEPTVVRGHLARPGSPAEAHLLAWDALAWRAPDPDALRDELAEVHAWRRGLEQSADPVARTLISRRGRQWPVYRALVREIARAIVPAMERRAEAAACLLRALEAEGYLGEDPIHFGSTADRAMP